MNKIQSRKTRILRYFQIGLVASLFSTTGCGQLRALLGQMGPGGGPAAGMTPQAAAGLPLGAPQQTAAAPRTATAPFTDTTRGNLSNPGGSAALAPATTGSALDQRIDAAAKQVAQVGPGEFPYAPETREGALGCAQVASTALENAGAIQGVELSVNGLVDKLRGQGWVEVQACVGAVVARQGEAGSHIGVVIQQEGGLAVMHNSTGAREPRITSVEGFGTITVVLHSSNPA